MASDLVPLEGMVIREASEADNAALLRLTRATPMAGKIALRIDREPDFFALIRARASSPGEARLFVAEHATAGIVGSMSSAVYRAYVAGRLERVAHAGDLKVHPEFTGRRLALRLVAAIEDDLRGRGIDLSFNLVADGNARVLRIAEGRHGTPVQTMLGRFFVDELVPLPFGWRSREYGVADAVRGDVAELLRLHEEFARARNFARPVLREQLEARVGAADATVLVAHGAGRVVATITLENTARLRRNVMVGAPPALRAAMLAGRVVPGLRLPRLGEPMRILHVRYPACEPEHAGALRALLGEARRLAYGRRAHFVSLGLHERDPLRAALAGMARFTFTSRAMATSLLTKDRMAGIEKGLPYEDFALV